MLITRVAYNARAYDIAGAGSSPRTLNVPTQGSLLAGKKYIFSFFVDTKDATEDVTVQAFIGQTAFTPIASIASQASYIQGATMVLPKGSESTRIAFEYNPNSTVSGSLVIHATSAVANKVYVYKLQLEEAAYKNDSSLPSEIRSRTAPTPWTANSSTSTSSARLTIKAEPSPDVESYAAGSLGSQQKYIKSGVEANRRQTPSEMLLELSNGYAQNDGGGEYATSARASYKWSTVGMSYPGVAYPFMPTAASISWNYDSMGTKPMIGGNSSRTSLAINPAGFDRAAINIGLGRSVEDDFNRGNDTYLGPNWMRVGTYPMEIVDQTTRRRHNPDIQEDGIPGRFAYYADPLDTINQEVSGSVANSSVLFGSTWRPNIVLIANYNPNNGDGIFFRILDYQRRWQLFVRINGVTTYQQAGTYSSYVSGYIPMRLTRNGSSVSVFLDGRINSSFTVSNLPTGKSVGFTNINGRMDDFFAKDLVAGSTAMGELKPHSINVNNGRGISVSTNGTIEVGMPGYYMVTATIRGPIGGHVDRTYWLQLHDNYGGSVTHNPIGGLQNRGLRNLEYITGTAVCHLQGSLTLMIYTETTNNTGYVHGVELDIVRMM